MFVTRYWEGVTDCQCGCGLSVLPQSVQLADKAAMYVFQMTGKKAVITSGARCAKHNAAVGGKLNSAHIKGLALDWYAKDDAILYWLLRGAVLSNASGIGLYKGKKIIHMDVAALRDGIYRPAAWVL